MGRRFRACPFSRSLSAVAPRSRLSGRAIHYYASWPLRFALRPLRGSRYYPSRGVPATLKIIDKISHFCAMEVDQLQTLYTRLAPFLTDERLAKIDHYALASSAYVLPVMEDIYQFRNAAAIVRSAEACGFHKIVALEAENIFNPNLRITKGAETWVEVEKKPHTMETFEEIRRRGFKMLAVSPEKEAVSLPDFDITEPVALIFGTEKEGVTPEVLDFADATLSIPMYGFTQSYNVSVAAAICFYELRQKLERSNLDFKLKEAELLALKIRWAVNSMRSGHEVYAKILSEL